jgi:S-adenosylmethionine hydrolase
MPVVSLTTDFGSGDHEAGVLKGVIWSIAPRAHIVDLTHEIPPQSIFEAALLLWRATPYFPDGSIHVAVVDPGVGTERRGIAAQLGTQYFVGPDNGLVTLILGQAESKNEPVSMVNLDQPIYWLSEISNIFHGRDIFAPVAGHLARGTPLKAFGSTITDPIRIDMPNPRQIIGGWEGHVIHIDHFGNLGTNLNVNHLQGSKEVVIKIKGIEIAGMVSTFGERPVGRLIALLDSSGSLAISVVNGSAAQKLGAAVGDKFEVQLNS